MLDLTKLEDRLLLIKKIESDSNLVRKKESFIQSDVFKNNTKKYVIAELNKSFTPDTVNEMPVVSSINVQKKVVDQDAIVYKETPERSFEGVSDEQQETYRQIYKDGRFNQKLVVSNQGLKYQDQACLMIIPKNGKLIMRYLKNHHYDVYTDDDDKETAKIYILSDYDNSNFIQIQDDVNPTGVIPQYDQYDSSAKSNDYMKEVADQSHKIYTVWTDEFNFKMRSNGEIVNNDVLAHGLGRLPFIDISTEKEFDFFVQTGNALSDFTVEFNARFSEFFQVCKMQGFAQAYLSGPENLIPQSLQIGAAFILKLVTDPNTGDAVKFGYENPNSDLQGGLAAIEALVSAFLSTRGINPKEISASGESVQYTSGLDRLLAMIDKISANKEDFETYQAAEESIFDLVNRWQEALKSTSTLDSKYVVGSIHKDASISVKYFKPNLIQTEREQLDNYDRKNELGLESRIEYIMKTDKVSKEVAIEKAQETDQLEKQYGVTDGISQGDETFQVGSIAND